MPLPRTRRLGFAVGDTGFNLVWQSVELYLLFFYSEVLGLPLAWAAAIFFIGAVVDWIADPAIGVLADRSAARSGRMRGWLLGAAPAMGLALTLAFAKPQLSTAGLFAWALATHILLRIAYSCGNIPYAALTARISNDRREQARLTGLRMQCAAIGGLTVAAVYLSAPALSADDPARFLVGAAVLGLLIQPFLLTTWRTAVEIVPARAPPGPFRLGAELRAFVALLRRGRALRRVLAIILFAGLTTSLLGKSILFLFEYDLGRPQSGFFATFAPPLALLVTAPLWVLLSDRQGNERTLAGAAALHALTVAAFAGSALAGGPVLLSAVLLVLAVAATTGMSVMFWAMVPATIAEASAGGADGHARVYSLANSVRKLAQALASPLLAAGLLVTRELEGDGVASPMLAAVALGCAAAIWRLSRPDR